MQTVLQWWGVNRRLVLVAIVAVSAGCSSAATSPPDADTPRRGNDATVGTGGSAGDAGKDTPQATGGTGGDTTPDAPVDQPAVDKPADLAADVPSEAGVDQGGSDRAPGTCTIASDCPGQDTECSKRTCVQGVCGTATLAAGLPVPLQVAGDCKIRQCDDKAQVVMVQDNNDVPQDGNPCTLDVCTAGVPSHPSAPLGQACGGTSKCDGNGQCVGCNIAADCPGDDNVCQTRTCVQNVCGFNRVAAGTPIAMQTARDCKVVQCDGQGNTTTVNDNNDKPDDGNACTSDVCTLGVASNPPLAAGTTCGNGKTCDGAGRCGQCSTAAECGTSNECRTYTCTQGACQVTYAAAGTALAAQSMGDCKVAQCDGAGNTTQAADDTDLPVDGNPCTKDVCTAGVPSHPSEPNTTTCGTNSHCDGAGQCLFCTVAADCGTNPCKTYTCSAQGACGSTSVAAGTPSGEPSANQCAQMQCDGNGGSGPVNLGTSTTCNTNGGTHCDGAGMCVAAAPQTFMVLRVVATALGASSASPVLIEERSVTDGSLVRTITMPTMANPGSNKAVMLSGSAGSEGWLTRSEDTHYLIVAGYNPTTADQALKVVKNGAERVVARVNASGTIETYGVTSTAFITDNLRGATSTNGTDIWAFGDGSTKSGGAWYVQFNNATGVQIFGSATTPPAPSASRACQINGGRLFCTSDKTNFVGVSQVGMNSAPMVGPQPVNLLAGFTGGPTAYQLSFVSTTSFYLATEGAAGVGGVQRWTFQSASGNWTAGNNVDAGSTGARGVVALASGNDFIVLATTADADGSGNAAVNRIVKFVDTGSGTPTGTTLVTAPDGSFFRGLALPPQ